MDTVVGVFEDRVEADLALQDFKDHGYDARDISIIARQPTHADRPVGKKGGSAAAGATAGGILGGLTGLLIGIGTIAIPGVGIFLVGGPIAAALGLTGAAATAVTGAATGALAGGIVGALVGMGLPEEDAQMYQERIKEGAILLAVPVENKGEMDYVKEIFKYHAASKIRRIGEFEER